MKFRESDVTMHNLYLVLSAAQCSQIIRIVDMFTSCYKRLSYQLRNKFLTFVV